MPSACIYKLYHESNPDKLYIGSTKKSLSDRLKDHKSLMNRGRNSKIYSYLRPLDWMGVRIQTIEIFQYHEKKDILEKENYYIKLMWPELNTYNALLDVDQYTRHKAQYDAQYRELHKDRIKRRDKEYRELHKNKAKQYRELHKDKIKQYSQANAYRYICLLCDYYTYYKTHYNKHLLTDGHKSKNINNVKCNKCNLSFINKAFLQKHNRLNHPERYTNTSTSCP